MEAPSGLPANLPEGIRVKKDSAEKKFLMDITFSSFGGARGGAHRFEHSKPGTKKPHPAGRGFSKTHNLSVREELVICIQQGLLASGSSYSPHLPI